MSEYAPTSRRPIAAGFRRTADAATRFCVRHGIHPDTLGSLTTTQQSSSSNHRLVRHYLKAHSRNLIAGYRKFDAFYEKKSLSSLDWRWSV